MRWSLRRRRSKELPLRNLITPLVRPQHARLAVLSVTSIFAGFAEAATLVLIARGAFALTSPNKDVALSLGPLGSRTFSVGTLLATAALLVIVRMALQAVGTVAGTRLDACRRREQTNGARPRLPLSDLVVAVPAT